MIQDTLTKRIECVVCGDDILCSQLMSRLELKKQDLMPDIVQIGNEIRSGLLFPDGELADYEGMVKLVNAGIDGAREVNDPFRN